MSARPTTPDPAARVTNPNTERKLLPNHIIRVRRWGTDWKESIRSADDPPDHPPLRAELLIGTTRRCEIRVADEAGLVSNEHARLVYRAGIWRILDLDSTNGLWIDGKRCREAEVRAGTEIGLGRRFVLVAESPRTIALRMFLARVLGWASARNKAVDLALRSILATAQRGAIVLCSPSDPVAIAHSIHRIAFGSERPFVTCDPKRKNTKETVRWTHNFTTSAEALAAASGGTLCVWARRLTHDYTDVWPTLAEPTATARLVVCSNALIDGKKFGTVPIAVPGLGKRRDELHQIIREYGDDAIAELGGNSTHRQPEDVQWIARLESKSLAKIEAAALRLVALRMSRNLNQAAELLGMARSSLAEWIGRRKLPMRIEPS